MTTHTKNDIMWIVDVPKKVYLFYVCGYTQKSPSYIAYIFIMKTNWLILLNMSTHLSKET